MKIGKLIKTIVKLPAIPAALALDAMSLGVSKATDDKFFFEKAADWVDED